MNIPDGVTDVLTDFCHNIIARVHCALIIVFGIFGLYSWVESALYWCFDHSMMGGHIVPWLLCEM